MKLELTDKKNMVAKTLFKNLYSKTPLVLENGKELHDITVSYQTYGQLNENGSNGVLVCHALTGNAHAAGYLCEEEISSKTGFEFLDKYNSMNKNKPGWWDPIIGEEKALDTTKYFVVCINFIGSCYGSTGPASINPKNDKPYNLDFPIVTVRDMVRVQKTLLDSIGVNQLQCVTGGSLGGMQVLEWGIMYPEFVKRIVPIATSAAHSAWAVGLNHIARAAIMNDADWRSGNYSIQPKQGLALARKMAMMSYRSYDSFGTKFGRKVKEFCDGHEFFDVESYLNYQGEKFINRFDANTYIYITYAMDSHDVGKNRGSIDKALKSITAKTLCIGIDSDLLYPAKEQQEIASKIDGALYKEIKSEHGHDAFLIEFEQLEKLLQEFLD